MRQSSQVHLHEIGPQMDGADAFIQIVMSVKYLNVVYRCDFYGFFFLCTCSLNDSLYIQHFLLQYSIWFKI